MKIRFILYHMQMCGAYACSCLVVVVVHVVPSQDSVVVANDTNAYEQLNMGANLCMQY